MNNMVDAVFDFNERIIGLPVQIPFNCFNQDLYEWTLTALNEEINTEFVDAHRDQDLVGMVDALLDNVYFSIGALKKLGLSRDQVERCFLEAVHRRNMTKDRGVKGTRGDFEADAVATAQSPSAESMIADILFGGVR